MSNKPELVLTVPRTAITTALGLANTDDLDGVVIRTGLNYLGNIQHDFSFSDRKIVDGKTNPKIDLEKASAKPQLLGYVVVVDNSTNTILTYDRKGKETGLNGKSSIGVGGHVDAEDYLDGMTLAELIIQSTERELKEEINIDVRLNESNFKGIIISNADDVSKVHIGLAAVVYLDNREGIELENHLINPRWLSVDQLSGDQITLETWSKILVESDFLPTVNLIER